MRLGIVPVNSGQCVALAAGNGWYNLTKAILAYEVIREGSCTEAVTTIESLILSGRMRACFIQEVLDVLRQCRLLGAYAFADAPARFLMPVQPGKVLALGRNYAAHAAESGHEPPREPIFFAKPPSACIADGEPIVVKPWYGRVDHEAELAVVIGERAKDVPPERALEYVAGYTLMNDVTARDMQKTDIDAGHPWFRSKGIDTFGPLGPLITLPEAMPSPLAVEIELTVNGETRQKSNTALFVFPVSEVIAYLTRFVTLEPGDVISTGTPEGISPICPGDVVEVRVPQIGTLRNPVVAG